jgi:hypothetical protein
MRVMRRLVVLVRLCLSFIGAAPLRAGDSSDKWFTLLHQTAELYEANAVSEAEKILQHALEMIATSVIVNIDWQLSENSAWFTNVK